MTASVMTYVVYWRDRQREFVHRNIVALSAFLFEPASVIHRANCVDTFGESTLESSRDPRRKVPA